MVSKDTKDKQAEQAEHGRPACLDLLTFIVSYHRGIRNVREKGCK